MDSHPTIRRHFRRLSPTMAIAALAMLAACSVTAHDFPPAPLHPILPDAAYVTPEYRIRVGDVLDLRILLNPELNEEVTVRPDGHISTTVLTDMDAANKTIPQLVSDLIVAYSHVLRAPRLSVIVKSIAPTEIFVAGEVNKPGEFSTPGTAPTLSQALAQAGGLKMSGDGGSIFIIRRRANDTPEFLATRYNALTHARDPSADVRLAPFDVVYVPRTGIAEVYAWYNQYIQQFANPSFNFSYFLNPDTAAANSVTQAAH